MIKAHLIRTSEVDEEVFASVVQYLQQFKGEVEFIHHDAPMVISGRPKRVIKKVDDDFDVQEEFLMNKLCDSEIRLKSVDLDFDKVNAYPWEKFFDLIKKFRKQSNQKEKENPIPALTQEYNAPPGDSDHVFILTYQANVEKWFVGSEAYNGRNHFVHLLYWHHYILSEPVYPVAYHIMSTILKNETFGDITKYIDLTHDTPKGCMMDMCWNKTDVILKLRTADICPDCMRALTESSVNRKLLNQTLKIFDHVRAQVLFRERFLTLQTYPHLVLDRKKGELVFPELSNLKVKLTPLELTTYCFFIQHPLGVILSYLPDYLEEILSIYMDINPHMDRESAKERVLDLTNPLSNSISEKISRIKSKLKNMLGDEIAQPFMIQGPNGGLKKIEISRDQVTYLHLG